jgi:hypothetical protein
MGAWGEFISCELVFALIFGLVGYGLGESARAVSFGVAFGLTFGLLVLGGGTPAVEEVEDEPVETPKPE